MCHRRVGCDRKLADGQLNTTVDRINAFLRGGTHALASGKQVSIRISQRHAPGRAIEQWQTMMIFQLHNVVAELGGRQFQPLRSVPE